MDPDGIIYLICALKMYALLKSVVHLTGSMRCKIHTFFWCGFFDAATTVQ